MVVRLHRGQLNWFRLKARRCSPREILAYLIGHRRTPNVLAISYFAYPVLSVSMPTQVEVSAEVVQQIMDEAGDRGFSVLGSIHSHTPPSPSPVLSECDHRYHCSNGDAVTGIVALHERSRAETTFWVADSSLPCKVEYFE